VYTAEKSISIFASHMATTKEFESGSLELESELQLLELLLHSEVQLYSELLLHSALQW
jgi:hypothetical protein